MSTAPQTLIAPELIERRVHELAAEIRRDFGADTPIHLVGVLKGAFIFLADLLRAFEGPVTCDFLAVSSYGARRSTSGEVRLIKDVDTSVDGRHLVLVEDIVDSGHTLAYLQELLRARHPARFATVALLAKPARRAVDVTVDYVGFEIPDRFVVGYGLDLDEAHRHLPGIATVD
jgi:hypoxanthine phosphoribosyltransferase